MERRTEPMEPEALGVLADLCGRIASARRAEFEVALQRAAARAESMAALEDNWDGEGSPGYQQETLDRAVALARRSGVAAADRRLDSALPVPAFAKGPDGSVDVLWWNADRRLLINVPADDEAPVTFHGFATGHADRETRGRLPLQADNAWLVSWLTGA